MSRRDAILEAALESFADGGEVAIEEVRRRSGASVGSIYHHFGGKDGIAAALYVETLADYQSGTLRTLRRAGTPRDGVESLVRHHLRWVERNPDRARLLLQGRAIRKSMGGELGEMNQAFRAAIEEWIEDQPTIRSLPWEVFYGTTIGPAQEVARLWLAGRVRSLRRLERELAEAAWRAVRED